MYGCFIHTRINIIWVNKSYINGISKKLYQLKELHISIIVIKYETEEEII